MSCTYRPTFILINVARNCSIGWSAILLFLDLSDGVLVDAPLQNTMFSAFGKRYLQTHVHVLQMEEYNAITYSIDIHPSQTSMNVKELRDSTLHVGQGHAL